ncbi:MAG: hypothetical protein UT48_C0007G0019 [Parcubacteria group bacterium GW2011_GWE2_39_37]|nr:MAG: hypothetical protein UT48_C0007G0019 [Parcubacteria group bacterium GW2011_GWE2_39_37]
MKKNLYRYSYFWITLVFFIASLVLQWVFGWYEYKNEQEEHGQPIEIGSYVVQLSRGVFENWQSEFLQLIWQVVGLSFLYYAGSSQSKESDDRKEEKIDYIIKKLDPKNSKSIIQKIDMRYWRKK